MERTVTSLLIEFILHIGVGVVVGVEAWTVVRLGWKGKGSVCRRSTGARSASKLAQKWEGDDGDNDDGNVMM